MTRRVPLEVRIRNGNPGKQPLPQPLVPGSREEPPMPRDLSPTARACWRYIVKDLSEAGILAHSDAGVVEMAACVWARAREARREVDREGLTITTPQGRVEHPAGRIERACQAEFRQLATHLGLSPSSRAGLGSLVTARKTLGIEAAHRLPPTTRRHLVAVGDDG